MIRRVGKKLRDQIGGATVIEFAIITPVMLTLIMGLGELTYQGYVQSILTGAVQKAGRDSTLQGNGTQTAQLDAVVIAQLAQLRSGWALDCSGNPPPASATYCSTRKSYSNFITVGPEPFTDTAGTGVYDASKDCFTDVNGNGTWDADPGTTGQGGANDVAVYSMKITYPRVFPVLQLVGLSPTATLTGMTTLKNQPWATQNAYAPVQICPH